MLKTETRRISWTIVALLLFVGPVQAADPLGTNFSYQGQLKQGGVPLNNTADLEFSLYDAATNGLLAAGPITVSDVVVVDGLFQASLDFGVVVLDGSALWLEVAVRSPHDPGDTLLFTTLDPRQPLTASPYALQTRGLFVDTAGNVGIGTDMPAEALEVVGTIAADRYIGDGASLSGVSRVGSTVDLNNVALLRWDLLNSSFPVGNSPYGVAFDGANIWVANNGSHNVTKLRASDGFNLGTFPVGGAPFGVAFDGANIWVANTGSNTVTKLRASDGINLGTFPVGDSPAAVAFDGSNIWVANRLSNTVTKLRASDGFNLGTFPAGVGPIALAFDGSNIWVANSAGANVTELRASDGFNLGTFPVGSAPFGLAFDGSNIWVANLSSANVTKLRASDGFNLGTFSVGDGPYSVAFDGANIWVANFNSDNVTKLRASDGSNRGTFPVDNSPLGVAFDGANIWITNFTGDNVTRLSLVK